MKRFNTIIHIRVPAFDTITEMAESMRLRPKFAKKGSIILYSSSGRSYSDENMLEYTSPDITERVDRLVNKLNTVEPIDIHNRTVKTLMPGKLYIGLPDSPFLIPVKTRNIDL